MDIVVGLRLPSQPPVMFEYYVQEGRSRGEETLELPDPCAEQLAAFCRQYYVGGTGIFDSRALVFKVMGWKGGDASNWREVSPVGPPTPTDPTELVAGKPYAIAPSNKSTPSCYMLGLKRPGFALTIGGTRQPLVVASAADLMKVYGGVIGEVLSVVQS